MAVLYSQAEGVGVRLVFLKCFGFNQLRQNENPNQTTNGRTHTRTLQQNRPPSPPAAVVDVVAAPAPGCHFRDRTLLIFVCAALPLLMLLLRLRRRRLLSLLGVVVVVADDRTTLYLTANVRLVCRGSGSLRVGGKTAKESR